MSEKPMIHETAVVDDDVAIGAGTKVWHWVHICSGAEIGNHSVLGQNVYIGPNVPVGDHVKIQNNVSVYSGVRIANRVFVGPSAVFTNVRNPRAAVDRSAEFTETIVEEGVSIGANATIVCGLRLGAFSFVGAGSTVTKDIPPHALVLGVPSRQVGWVCHCGERLPYAFTDPDDEMRRANVASIGASAINSPSRSSSTDEHDSVTKVKCPRCEDLYAVNAHRCIGIGSGNADGTRNKNND